MLALLLGAAVCRSIIAGCPDGWGDRGLACLFLPTHTDLGIHLLSYALMGTILWGTFSWLVLWRQQWAKIRSLTRNLVLLRAPGNELGPLAGRLGLKDKVHLLDSEVPLCFCAGFIAPRIYLSRGLTAKLTPEQLEALLLHEKYHLKNCDPLKMLLGRLVVSALFFVPVLQDVLTRYLIEKEIAADRSAIEYQGHCRGLAGALGKLVPERSTVPVTGLAAAGAEALDYRIDHMTGHPTQHPHPIPLSRLAISLLTIALILATVLTPLSGSHP